jgi:hypothetical protein
MYVQEACSFIRLIKDEYMDVFEKNFGLELFLKMKVDVEQKCVFSRFFVRNEKLGVWIDSENCERFDLDVPLVKICETSDIDDLIRNAIRQLFLEIFSLDLC